MLFRLDKTTISNLIVPDSFVIELQYYIYRSVERKRNVKHVLEWSECCDLSQTIYTGDFHKKKEYTPGWCKQSLANAYKKNHVANTEGEQQHENTSLMNFLRIGYMVPVGAKVPNCFKHPEILLHTEKSL